MKKLSVAAFLFVYEGKCLGQGRYSQWKLTREGVSWPSVAVYFILMMAATHLSTTHHIQHTTTEMMRSYLLLQKNGEGNKRKKQILIFEWVMVKIKKYECMPQNTRWWNNTMGGANETNYFHLITHEAGLLIFPWRFSLSGCLQITTDEFLITLESEVLEQCWVSAYHS